MIAAARLLLMIGLAGLGADAEAPGGDMVLIPAGPAILGGVGHSTMPGPMRVDVPTFWVDRFEVTNVQYRAFVAASGHEPALFDDDPALNAPDQPVTGVTWADAAAYCRWAGKRLPSEVEWEKAARGTDGRIYPWGSSKDLTRAHLSGEAPVSVTAFPGDVSPYGVRGMAGNVSEWVGDQFLGGGFCGHAAGRVNTTAAPSPRAYIRGASWAALPHMAKSYHHLWDYPDAVAEFVGFRCVRAADGG